jgi:hypothetical protein
VGTYPSWAGRSGRAVGKRRWQPPIPTRHPSDHLQRKPQPSENRGHHARADPASGTDQPIMTSTAGAHSETQHCLQDSPLCGPRLALTSSLTHRTITRLLPRGRGQKHAFEGQQSTHQPHSSAGFARSTSRADHQRWRRSCAHTTEIATRAAITLHQLAPRNESTDTQASDCAPRMSGNANQQKGSAARMYKGLGLPDSGSGDRQVLPCGYEP